MLGCHVQRTPWKGLSAHRGGAAFLFNLALFSRADGGIRAGSVWFRVLGQALYSNNDERRRLHPLSAHLILLASRLIERADNYLTPLLVMVNMVCVENL